MDDTQPAEPTQRPLLRSSALLIPLGVVLLLIAAWCLYQTYAVRTSDQHLYLSFGPLPFGQMYALKDDPTQLAPRLVNAGGRSLPVLAAEEAADGSVLYILFTDPASKVSQVYRQLPDGTLTALTSTPTLKYNLSYDDESKSLVYEETDESDEEQLARIADHQIVFLSLDSGTPTPIGVGTRPILLPGGRQALVLTQGRLLMLPTVPGAASESGLAVMLGSLMAVDADGTRAAVYNPSTHSIDFFSISESPSPFAYQRSMPIEYLPTALGFVDGALWAAIGPVRDDVWAYQVREVETGTRREIRIDSEQPLSSITRIQQL